jgi:hypothetical protein
MEGSTDTPIRIPAWLVRLCKWCWGKRIFLFGTLIGGILLNLIYALPLIDPSTIHNLVIAWFFAHWYVLSGIVLLLVLLITLCGLIARLSVPMSRRALRRGYLKQVTRDTELTTLKGIPAGFILPSVRLADIYIPPRFHPNRTRVDLPFSDWELERYRQCLRLGTVSPDQEQAVLEAENNWLHVLKQGDLVRLDEVWQQLSARHAVVIQGYPGMGKSTLMERLTLHMAARGLRQADPDMPERTKLMPDLIPILLSLGQYASEAFPREGVQANLDAGEKEMQGQTNEVLSLPAYLLRKMKKMDLPGLAEFIQQELVNGNCLVLLDALDEVSDQVQRERVQEEIRSFVGGGYHRCRFVITSRVAGYDQEAFPHYPHFTLATLRDEEIAYFLPRWCQANLDREGESRKVAGSSAQIAKEVNKCVEELQGAIGSNEGVRRLAENPLLLTLLLVMQQNSVVLPRQRVELYDIVTRTLLENRQVLKKSEVSEFQAIERLGPLAFQMQEANSDFVRQREVEKQLMDVIRKTGGAEDEVRAEAKLFLERVRVRGGLFVLRVSDYLGFMHRTFQEYFAARYILNNIKTEPDRWINWLVQHACRQDALWREPFLLAVAYPSYHNDEHIASRILHELLLEAAKSPLQQKASALVLAVEAIIEARPLTIRQEWQKEAAMRLLGCYEQAQHQRTFEVCDKIEPCLRRWLLSLPKEAYRLPLLDVISEAIRDITRQRSVLTLLTMIAQELEPCSSLVFSALIPPLLALTGLPAIGPHHPSDDLTVSTDFDVIDLAFSALSFFGKHGPSGLYLKTIQEYFEKNPEQLHLLARYSLECGTLITPYQRAIKIA